MKLGAANVGLTRRYSAVLVHAMALLSSFVAGLLFSGASWTALLSWPTLNPRFGNWSEFAVATILSFPLGLTLLFVYATGKCKQPWTKHTRSLFFAGGFLGATAVIVFYVFVVVIFSISFFAYGEP